MLSPQNPANELRLVQLARILTLFKVELSQREVEPEPVPLLNRLVHNVMSVCAFVFLSSDFDKKAKSESSPLLEQFLCHVAKTGETM